MNIYISITPDILHQLLQGVMKHLIAWLSDLLIFGGESINARCRLVPPNHQIVLFPKGISILSYVSGKEHKNICRLLLGLVVDLQLHDGSSLLCLLRAIHGLLDFLYLAQLPSQTANTITCLECTLLMFHKNKDIFVDLGVQDHFNIPKIHSLLHYSLSIHLFGTADNYNTEQTEQLHIDFVKDAYCSTNHKDKYPQMTTWLEHHEKVQQHAIRIKLRQQQHFPASALHQGPIGTPPQPGTCYLKMTQNPTLWRVSFKDVTYKYGATDFQDLLGDFLAHLKKPHLSEQALCNHGENTLIRFHCIPVFHKIKFTNRDGAVIDSVHIQLEQVGTHGRIIPACFDTVLVWTGQQPGNACWIQGRFWSDHWCQNLANLVPSRL